MPAELSMQGKRVWLRPIEIHDAEALAPASHRERETAFTGGRIPLSVLSFERWIAGLGEDEHVFAICRHGAEHCIGTVSLRRIDMENATAETGIGLLDAADRGHGLGTEAKALLLSYAFDLLGLHAVSCTIASVNARSIRAVERQGYRYAGRLTGAVTTLDGQPCDQVVYDLTREEWKALQG
jgi:RimJ/RimL family protein N-acetyltransferase